MKVTKLFSLKEDNAEFLEKVASMNSTSQTRILNLCLELGKTYFNNEQITMELNAYEYEDKRKKK